YASTLSTKITEKINAINDGGASNLTLVSYNNFVSTYLPMQDALEASGLKSILDTFEENVDYKQKVKDAIKEYNNLLDEFSADTKKNQKEFAEYANKINEFKYKYPSFKVYLTNVASVQSHIEASNRDAWVTDLVTHQESPTYLKYLKQYKDEGGDDETVGIKLAKISSKSIATKAVSGGAFDENYKNGIVTNFNIAPWAEIFPELIQTATLNDADQVILEGIAKTFDDFERKFNYLKISKKLDSTSRSNNTKDTILQTYDIANQNIYNLKLAIQLYENSYVRNPKLTDDYKINFNNQSFSFRDRIKTLADLDLALNNYLNSLPTDDQFKQWSNAYDQLKEYGFIGNYGTIPAYTVHNGFGTHNDTGSIPMARNVSGTSYSNNEQKNNPLRTILELISLTLRGGGSVNAFSYLSYNPGNVEANATTHTSERYNDDDFNRRFNIKNSSLSDVLSQMIPNNNSQYNIMGIVPILTNKSIVEDNANLIIIKNVALLDSAGNIWNPNKISNGVIDKVDNSTNLFTLKIDKDTGVAEIPEAKLYEYHWQFGDDAGSKSYNNMILLAPNKTLDTCWGKGENHFTPTCVQTSKNDDNQQPALQIYPIHNQEATRLGGGWLDEGLVKADEYCRIVNPKGSTSVNFNNGIFFSDTYYNANNWFCMEQFTYERSTTDSGNVGRDGTWSTGGNGYIKSTYVWNKGFELQNLNRYTDLFNQYKDSVQHIPHGLQLIPLTPNTLININNKISKDKQNPLFPTYNF
ncbi:MAG: hypothetical protein PHC75_02485, partial [Burkholderiales bacterium]|nr:hypothetical protein [Burkholderiales bacterium]